MSLSCHVMQVAAIAGLLIQWTFQGDTLTMRISITGDNIWAVCTSGIQHSDKIVFILTIVVICKIFQTTNTCMGHISVICWMWFYGLSYWRNKQYSIRYSICIIQCTTTHTGFGVRTIHCSFYSEVMFKIVLYLLLIHCTRKNRHFSLPP